MSASNASNSSTFGNILWAWVSNSTASNSDELETQITCYAFPYGGLGFVAHLVMFYGIALSSLNKCPWRPSKPLTHSGWDLIFGVVGLVVSSIFAAVTLYRCSGAKQYLLIAWAKILVTVTSSAIGIHIAWNLRGRENKPDKSKERDEPKEIEITHHETLRWFVVEFLGSILELVGVVMVLEEEYRSAVEKRVSVMIISAIFAGFMGFVLSGGIIWLEIQQRAQRRMDWEVRKVQTECTSLEERLAAQRPRGRFRINSRQDTPGSDERAPQSPGPNAREGTPRQSGQRNDGPVRDASRDLEAQRLISPSSEEEASKEPVLYHYKDVLNSVKQALLVAGAAFSLSMTLYTDWVLAAVSGSYLGFPTTGNVPLTAVYVIFYFFVRLIPVLSF